MIKIVTLLGTRPEAIKSITSISELKKNPEIETEIWLSHQHPRVAEQILEIAYLEADVSFRVFSKRQSNITTLSKILKNLDLTIKKRCPNWLVVQGDTLTALAGALAGFYNNVNVAHLEAGLRSFNPKSPFPEEVNRNLISRIASVHFAPNKQAYKNLIQEGIYESDVTLCENLGLDLMVKLLKEEMEVIQNPAMTPQTILVTIHRKELLLHSGLEKTILSLRDLADSLFSKAIILFPLHPNPLISKLANKHLSGVKNIVITHPMPYRDFIKNLLSASLIITDSGGIQDEAAFLEKPTIILREATEREILNPHKMKLVNPWDEQLSEKIISLANDLLKEYHYDVERIKQKIDAYSYNANIIVKKFNQINSKS